MPHGAIDWLTAPEFKTVEQILFEQNAYSVYGLTTASYADHPYLNLINPVGSDLVCRVTSIYWRINKAATLTLGILGFDGGVMSYQKLNRYFGGPDPTCIMRGGDQTSFTIQGLRTVFTTGEAAGEFLNLSYVLTPGTRLSLIALAVGSQLSATIEFHEIAI